MLAVMRESIPHTLARETFSKTTSFGSASNIQALISNFQHESRSQRRSMEGGRLSNELGDGAVPVIGQIWGEFPIAVQQLLQSASATAWLGTHEWSDRDLQRRLAEQLAAA